MVFDEKTFECSCNKCNYSWRARTEQAPKKCPSCTSVNWNVAGRSYQYILARCSGTEEGTGRRIYCILEDLERPDVITEDVFYIKPEDQDFLKNVRTPIGSAILLIGNFEIGEDLNLVIKDIKLAYVHVCAFRVYNALNLVYNKATRKKHAALHL